MRFQFVITESGFCAIYDTETKRFYMMFARQAIRMVNEWNRNGIDAKDYAYSTEPTKFYVCNEERL